MQSGFGRERCICAGLVVSTHRRIGASLRVRGALALIVLLVMMHAGAVVAQVAPTSVTVEMVSPVPIVAPINQPLAEPIRVRVRNASTGAPVAGVIVHVGINLSLCFPVPVPPSGPSCEEAFELLYGAFGPGPDGPSGAQATTDASGIATFDGYHTGVTVGGYQFIVGVYASQNGGQFQSPPVSLLPAIIQVSGAAIEPRVIPTADAHSLLLLGMLLLLASGFALRAHGRGA